MKVCVIGCGSIAKVHGECIAKIKENVICAAADIMYNRAVSFTDIYGGRPYTDWRKMVYEIHPDTVHICTPHNLHAQIACELLKLNIHVFCEKPPVINEAQYFELNEVYEDAKKKGIRFAVCFQNRFNPETEYVRKLLNEGKFGDIIGVRGIVTWHRDEEYYKCGIWRGNAEEAGGGALSNQGIHTLDLMQYFINDKAEEINAMMNNFHLADKVDVEDTLCAYISYSKSARACFYVTTGYAVDSEPIIELICDNGSMRIEGNKVRASYNGKCDVIKCFTNKPGFGKSYWGAGHEVAIRTFYERVRESKPYTLDYENVKETIKLMLDIYKKANKNGGF